MLRRGERVRLERPWPGVTLIERRCALTSRQLQCLEMVCYGLSNREIAAEMFITEHGVKTTLTDVYTRLGLPPYGRRRIEAVRWYWRNIDPRQRARLMARQRMADRPADDLAAD